MSLRKVVRFVLALGVGSVALLLGLTILPYTQRPEESWRPFIVLTTLLIGLVLGLAWLVAPA